MSRLYGAAGAALAGLCGVLVMYTSLRPELEKRQQLRDGTFQEEHKESDKVISQAIVSDFKQARDQVEKVDKGGFAWGIRQALFGKKENAKSALSLDADSSSERKT